MGYDGINARARTICKSTPENDLRAEAEGEELDEEYGKHGHHGECGGERIGRPDVAEAGRSELVERGGKKVYERSGDLSKGGSKRRSGNPSVFICRQNYMQETKRERERERDAR